MKSKWKWLILLLALIILIGVAYLLYNTFAKDYHPNTLVVNTTTTAETTETSTTAASSPDDSSAADHSTAEETIPTPALKTVPDFQVIDADGNVHQLSDFFGKPIVLNFWASWCPPCKAEMPDFEKAYQKYGEEFHFLMVNMTDNDYETLESAKAHIAQNGYTFPVYFDIDMEAFIAYTVYNLPATYFIHENGTLAAYAEGMLTADMLAQGLDMLK